MHQYGAADTKGPCSLSVNCVQGALHQQSARSANDQEGASWIDGHPDLGPGTQSRLACGGGSVVHQYGAADTKGLCSLPVVCVQGTLRQRSARGMDGQAEAPRIDGRLDLGPLYGVIGTSSAVRLRGGGDAHPAGDDVMGTTQLNSADGSGTAVPDGDEVQSEATGKHFDPAAMCARFHWGGAVLDPDNTLNHVVQAAAAGAVKHLPDVVQLLEKAPAAIVLMGVAEPDASGSMLDLAKLATSMQQHAERLRAHDQLGQDASRSIRLLERLLLRVRADEVSPGTHVLELLYLVVLLAGAYASASPDALDSSTATGLLTMVAEFFCTANDFINTYVRDWSTMAILNPGNRVGATLETTASEFSLTHVDEAGPPFAGPTVLGPLTRLSLLTPQWCEDRLSLIQPKMVTNLTVHAAKTASSSVLSTPRTYMQTTGYEPLGGTRSAVNDIHSTLFGLAQTGDDTKLGNQVVELIKEIYKRRCRLDAHIAPEGVKARAEWSITNWASSELTAVKMFTAMGNKARPLTGFVRALAKAVRLIFEAADSLGGQVPAAPVHDEPEGSEADVLQQITRDARRLLAADGTLQLFQSFTQDQRRLHRHVLVLVERLVRAQLLYVTDRLLLATLMDPIIQPSVDSANANALRARLSALLGDDLTRDDASQDGVDSVRNEAQLQLHHQLRACHVYSALRRLSLAVPARPDGLTTWQSACDGLGRPSSQHLRVLSEWMSEYAPQAMQLAEPLLRLLTAGHPEMREGHPQSTAARAKDPPSNLIICYRAMGYLRYDDGFAGEWDAAPSSAGGSCDDVLGDSDMTARREAGLQLSGPISTPGDGEARTDAPAVSRSTNVEVNMELSDDDHDVDAEAEAEPQLSDKDAEGEPISPLDTLMATPISPLDTLMATLRSYLDDVLQLPQHILLEDGEYPELFAKISTAINNQPTEVLVYALRLRPILDAQQDTPEQAPHVLQRAQKLLDILSGRTTYHSTIALTRRAPIFPLVQAYQASVDNEVLLLQAPLSPLQEDWDTTAITEYVYHSSFVRIPQFRNQWSYYETVLDSGRESSLLHVMHECIVAYGLLASTGVALYDTATDFAKMFSCSPSTEDSLRSQLDFPLAPPQGCSLMLQFKWWECLALTSGKAWLTAPIAALPPWGVHSHVYMARACQQVIFDALTALIARATRLSTTRLNYSVVLDGGQPPSGVIASHSLDHLRNFSEHRTYRIRPTDQGQLDARQHADMLALQSAVRDLYQVSWALESPSLLACAQRTTLSTCVRTLSGIGCRVVMVYIPVKIVWPDDDVLLQFYLHSVIHPEPMRVPQLTLEADRMATAAVLVTPGMTQASFRARVTEAFRTIPDALEALSEIDAMGYRVAALAVLRRREQLADQSAASGALIRRGYEHFLSASESDHNVPRLHYEANCAVTLFGFATMDGNFVEDVSTYLGEAVTPLPVLLTYAPSGAYFTFVDPQMAHCSLVGPFIGHPDLQDEHRLEVRTSRLIEAFAGGRHPDLDGPGLYYGGQPGAHEVMHWRRVPPTPASHAAFRAGPAKLSVAEPLSAREVPLPFAVLDTGAHVAIVVTAVLNTMRSAHAALLLPHGSMGDSVEAALAAVARNADTPDSYAHDVAATYCQSYAVRLFNVLHHSRFRLPATPVGAERPPTIEETLYLANKAPPIAVPDHQAGLDMHPHLESSAMFGVSGFYAPHGHYYTTLKTLTPSHYSGLARLAVPHHTADLRKRILPRAAAAHDLLSLEPDSRVWIWPASSEARPGRMPPDPSIANPVMHNAPLDGSPLTTPEDHDDRRDRGRRHDSRPRTSEELWHTSGDSGHGGRGWREDSAVRHDPRRDDHPRDSQSKRRKGGSDARMRVSAGNVCVPEALMSALSGHVSAEQAAHFVASCGDFDGFDMFEAMMLARCLHIDAVFEMDHHVACAMGRAIFEVMQEPWADDYRVARRDRLTVLGTAARALRSGATAVVAKFRITLVVSDDIRGSAHARLGSFHLEYMPGPALPRRTREYTMYGRPTTFCVLEPDPDAATADPAPSFVECWGHLYTAVVLSRPPLHRLEGVEDRGYFIEIQLNRRCGHDSSHFDRDYFNDYDPTRSARHGDHLPGTDKEELPTDIWADNERTRGYAYSLCAGTRSRNAQILPGSEGHDNGLGELPDLNVLLNVRQETNSMIRNCREVARLVDYATPSRRLLATRLNQMLYRLEIYGQRSPTERADLSDVIIDLRMRGPRRTIGVPEVHHHYEWFSHAVALHAFAKDGTPCTRFLVVRADAMSANVTGPLPRTLIMPRAKSEIFYKVYMNGAQGEGTASNLGATLVSAVAAAVALTDGDSVTSPPSATTPRGAVAAMTPYTPRARATALATAETATSELRSQAAEVNSYLDAPMPEEIGAVYSTLLINQKDGMELLEKALQGTVCELVSAEEMLRGHGSSGPGIDVASLRVHNSAGIRLAQWISLVVQLSQLQPPTDLSERDDADPLTFRDMTCQLHSWPDGDRFTMTTSKPLHSDMQYRYLEVLQGHWTQCLRTGVSLTAYSGVLFPLVHHLAHVTYHRSGCVEDYTTGVTVDPPEPFWDFTQHSSRTFSRLIEEYDIDRMLPLQLLLSLIHVSDPPTHAAPLAPLCMLFLGTPTRQAMFRALAHGTIGSDAFGVLHAFEIPGAGTGPSLFYQELNVEVARSRGLTEVRRAIPVIATADSEIYSEYRRILVRNDITLLYAVIGLCRLSADELYTTILPGSDYDEFLGAPRLPDWSKGESAAARSDLFDQVDTYLGALVNSLAIATPPSPAALEVAMDPSEHTISEGQWLRHMLHSWTLRLVGMVTAATAVDHRPVPCMQLLDWIHPVGSDPGWSWALPEYGSTRCAESLALFSYQAQMGFRPKSAFALELTILWRQTSSNHWVSKTTQRGWGPLHGEGPPPRTMLPLLEPLTSQSFEVVSSRLGARVQRLEHATTHHLRRIETEGAANLQAGLAGLQANFESRITDTMTQERGAVRVELNGLETTVTAAFSRELAVANDAITAVTASVATMMSEMRVELATLRDTIRAGPNVGAGQRDAEGDAGSIACAGTGTGTGMGRGTDVRRNLGPTLDPGGKSRRLSDSPWRQMPYESAATVGGVGKSALHYVLLTGLDDSSGRDAAYHVVAIRGPLALANPHATSRFQPHQHSSDRILRAMHRDGTPSLDLDPYAVMPPVLLAPADASLEDLRETVYGWFSNALYVDVDGEESLRDEAWAILQHVGFATPLQIRHTMDFLFEAISTGWGRTIMCNGRQYLSQPAGLRVNPIAHVQGPAWDGAPHAPEDALHIVHRVHIGDTMSAIPDSVQKLMVTLIKNTPSSMSHEGYSPNFSYLPAEMVVGCLHQLGQTTLYHKLELVAHAVQAVLPLDSVNMYPGPSRRTASTHPTGSFAAAPRVDKALTASDVAKKLTLEKSGYDTADQFLAEFVHQTDALTAVLISQIRINCGAASVGTLHDMGLEVVTRLTPSTVGRFAYPLHIIRAAVANATFKGETGKALLGAFTQEHLQSLVELFFATLAGTAPWITACHATEADLAQYVVRDDIALKRAFQICLLRIRAVLFNLHTDGDWRTQLERDVHHLHMRFDYKNKLYGTEYSPLMLLSTRYEVLMFVSAVVPDLAKAPPLLPANWRRTMIQSMWASLLTAYLPDTRRQLESTILTSAPGHFERQGDPISLPPGTRSGLSLDAFWTWTAESETRSMAILKFLEQTVPPAIQVTPSEPFVPTRMQHREFEIFAATAGEDMGEGASSDVSKLAESIGALAVKLDNRDAGFREQMRQVQARLSILSNHSDEPPTTGSGVGAEPTMQAMQAVDSDASHHVRFEPPSAKSTLLAAVSARPAGGGSEERCSRTRRPVPKNKTPVYWDSGRTQRDKLGRPASQGRAGTMQNLMQSRYRSGSAGPLAFSDERHIFYHIKENNHDEYPADVVAKLEAIFGKGWRTSDRFLGKVPTELICYLCKGGHPPCKCPALACLTSMRDKWSKNAQEFKIARLIWNKEAAAAEADGAGAVTFPATTAGPTAVAGASDGLRRSPRLANMLELLHALPASSPYAEYAQMALDVLDDPDTYRPLLSDSTSAAFSLLDADFDDLRSQAENCPDCDAAQALLTNLVESRQAETIALLEMAE